ncbi:MAG: class II glutamine amidotransferase [Candidatus Odinarchaeota archaeon]
MCRMIAAVKSSGIGKALFTKIWDGLRDMANDQTFKHELHDHHNLEPGEYKHGDGWGCSWLRPDNSLKSYHNLVPIWQDTPSGELIEEISSSPFLMIHARKASPGFAVTEEYCHPFIRESPLLGKAAFAHNGTIEEFDQFKFSNKYIPRIRSDTERFFYAALTNLEKISNPREELLNEVITNLPRYSGANFFLFMERENELWASRNYTAHERFLSLYYLVKNDFLVISSEKICSLGNSWVNLENHQLIKVNIQNSEISIY